ncbi:MAG: hypothetical protein ACREA0_02945 [bacterium]
MIRSFADAATEDLFNGSIRINDQYRVCFRWKGGYADEVEVTDYH